ncbi:MAG TPA: GNAT family N-acetyltransferase [Rhodanobacteraceae bacterium]|nr:GNAT family N-acetyltransferase [Rhodanobacteraceae bacterium]
MALRDEPVLQLQVPAVEEYLALRVAAGLSAMSPEGAHEGLARSWCSVCVRSRDGLIGMGRVVGDGGLFLFVVDIAVAPAWQRRGLGRRIMQALMEQVHARAYSRTMVGLIADGTANRLYEQFGFKLVAPAAQGMLLRIEKGENA